MFATIKSLIPEPRQADQPRHYVGRHRQPETVAARAAVPVIPAQAPDGNASDTTAPASPATPTAKPLTVPDVPTPMPQAPPAAQDPGEPAPRAS